MKNRTLNRRVQLPAPVEEAFDWHRRPGALERLTPPWESIRVVERGNGIEPGSRVILETPIGPIWKRWVAEHTALEEGRMFRDVQREGPFAHWEHTHSFEPDGPQASILEDSIEYRLPLGAVGHIFGGRTIARMLEAVFAYRQRTLRDDLSFWSRSNPTQPMKIAVTGSSGLVGSVLTSLLETGGHSVLRMVRREARGDGEVQWSAEEGVANPSRLEGVDAVVHLAGENIAGGRWTDEQKKKIRDSRVVGTKSLVDALNRLDQKPKALVCASAIGYYGDRGDERLDEASTNGSGFLADVCKEWEAAAQGAEAAGIRVVNSRFGVILSPAGGALKKMLLPFKMGGGGKIGSGEQYMSWITVDDAASALIHAATTETLAGPVNVVSPSPVTNAEYTKVLGKVLSRPTILPMPAFAAKLAFGEMAEELLLASQRVEPKKLATSGYDFRFTDLEAALRHLLGRSAAA